MKIQIDKAMYQHVATILKTVDNPTVSRNVMSISMLGSQKEYISERSLFLPDRESVIVFGGIDPHNTLGLGRNTGKDICR